MKTAVLIISCPVLFACAEDKKSFKFGAPAIAPIVDSTTPKGLKGGTALLDTEAFLKLIDTAATEESFKTYITNYVFKKDTTLQVAGPVFYRYWVDVLDTTMAQIDGRVAETEDTDDRCWNKEPVSVTHTFTIGAEEVSTTGKYNCWESQSMPNPADGGFQKMAFGKDETHVYLSYFTRDAAEFTGNQGERIIFAKASLDSTSAEIWFIGRSLQGGTAGTQISGVANRIIADKTTGAFSFGLTDEAIGSTNCAMYARSNGTALNFQARTPLSGSSTECQDVENMAWGTGACYDAATLAPATDCTGLDTVPANYGTSAPFKETDVKAIEDDSETIVEFDFAAAGIAEFK